MIKNRHPLSDVLHLHKEIPQNALETGFFSEANPLCKRFLNTSIILIIFCRWFSISTAIAGDNFQIPPSSWAVIGPFDNIEGSSDGPVYPPEYKKFRWGALYRGKWERKVTWQRLVWTNDNDEVLNFAQFLDDDNSIAYAFTTLHSTTRREVVLDLLSETQVRIWVNGTQVLSHKNGRDASRAIVELAAGWNQILAKTYSGKGEWAFRLRIESMNVQPLTGILCHLPDDMPSTRKAALFSMLLPGLGHIYLDDVKEGILILGGEVALISSSFLFDRYVLENSSDSSERSGTTDFFANPPLIAATELPLLGVYLAYRKAREKNHNIGYKQPLPDESLLELASAPFDSSIVGKPNFYLPFIFHFGTVYLLSNAIFSDEGTPFNDTTGDDVRVYGKYLHPSIGYPLGGTGLWLSFTAVSIGEEAFFRGYLQSTWEELMGEELGWLAASALFGALHYPNGTTTKGRIFASISAFTGGLVNGHFFRKDAYSLKRPIAYHTWWNFAIGIINLLQNPNDSIISGNIMLRF